MTSPDTELQVSGLTRSFATAAGQLAVLAGADLEARRGEAVAITGPSGSGKSTLLYIVGLLDEPTSGQVTIAGEQPHQFDAAGQARFRNRNIGFVFQDHHLLPQCTVLENVLIPVMARPDSGEGLLDHALQLLERVGLSERMDHRPAQLSGGERQRVAVCRALINAPLLLLADEPTGNLDQRTAEGIGTLLLEVAAEQGAILLCVTHSLELAARFPRRYELQAGKLISTATAKPSAQNE